MLKPVEVKALPGYRIWIAFEDGACGEIDLSDMAGKGAYRAWEEPGFFEEVHLAADGAIVWSGCVELSEYFAYKRLTGKSWDELPSDVEEMDDDCAIWQLMPVDVRPLSEFRIWVSYNDGVCGEVDLSEMAGKGVFKAWEDAGFFEKVHISPHRTIAWNGDLDICADALYMEITGKSWEELMTYEKSADTPVTVRDA